MDILSLLFQAETELPRLLHDKDIWQSIFIDYEKPHVERLWTPWNEYRINLHIIHPCCEHEVLFHPHPWPSAMKLVSGRYEMIIGFGESAVPPPTKTRLRLLLPAGVYYEMPHRDQWHSVRPLGNLSRSVMLTGKKWDLPTKPITKKLSHLAPERVSHLLRVFRDDYPMIATNETLAREEIKKIFT